MTLNKYSGLSIVYPKNSGLCVVKITLGVKSFTPYRCVCRLALKRHLLDRSQVAKASDFDSDIGGSNPSGPAISV